MKALVVNSLTKHYGPVVGAEDISFAIEPGQVFGYLGPNGSGKTTTIRCVMGFMRATSGKCMIMNKLVKPGMAIGHDDIGYLPGDFHAWEDLSSRKCLKVLSRLGDDPDTEGRRNHLAGRLGLNLDRKIGELSKGNRQKVGIINAFQGDPKILILDEPTVGLDPLVRQTVLELIRESAGGGTAVLLSSHDLSEVSAVCHDAAILRKGRLVELACISEIVAKGKQYLKVWFESPAENVTIPAKLEGIVKIIEQRPEMLHIGYTGHTQLVLQWLSKYPVERIITMESSLEDAFIQYYKDNNEAGDAK